MRGVLALLLAGALAAWGPLLAAEPAARLAEAGAQVSATSAALGAARDAPDRIAALSAAMADHEAALAGLRAAVNDAAVREAAILADLDARQVEVARLLATLQIVGRTPPPEVMLHPLGPLGAARAAGVMARLAPGLEQMAAALAADLGQLEAAGTLRADGAAQVQGGLAALEAARGDLHLAMTRSAAPPGDSDAATVRMGREAETLSALAAALGGGGGADGAVGASPAELRWPAAGTVLRGFNEADAAGVKRPGLVLGAAPRSLVIAPGDAIVRYVGPFLEYGYVVVLETDAQALIVLAGLAEVQVRTGDAVARGGFLGLLGGRPLDAEEYLMLPESGTGAGASETLYIEISQGRGPVDPAPWFDGGNG